MSNTIPDFPIACQDDLQAGAIRIRKIRPALARRLASITQNYQNRLSGNRLFMTRISDVSCLEKGTCDAHAHCLSYTLSPIMEMLEVV
jgi:hypothetical protein